ncbi:MAG: hypothetical protein CBC67_02010 [Gammaproteobacteria bacterium TMED107]|nr:hypothetical protein [Gammaproteobacteria bacterium]OUX76829.1 MAG: hypothetical protein CBC67_02010 [Gammaproteobacteria bacterium TMED107]
MIASLESQRIGAPKLSLKGWAGSRTFWGVLRFIPSNVKADRFEPDVKPNQDHTGENQCPADTVSI